MSKAMQEKIKIHSACADRVMVGCADIVDALTPALCALSALDGAIVSQKTMKKILFSTLTTMLMEERIIIKGKIK